MAPNSSQQYNFSSDNLFSVILQTNLSRIVKDTKPEEGLEPRPVYTSAQAAERYHAITGQQNEQFETFSKKKEFEFNNYANDNNYFQHEDMSKYIKEYKLSRNLSEDYPLFKTNILNNDQTRKSISQNKLKITLNPKIKRKGLNFGNLPNLNARRQEIKTSLNEILARSSQNKKNFRRIVKIMAFILSRERGSSIENSSTELLQREYGLMCWAIVNSAKAGRFECGGDILKLLKDLNYTNPYEHVKVNDDIKAENEVMTKIYNTNMGSQNNNLELFVMAFWDGYINDELNGYTNWSHAVNKNQYDKDGKKTEEIEFTFKNFQLPNYLKNSYDPDAIIDNILEYKIINASDISKLKITAEHKELLKITNTSKGDVFTLDGRVLFIKS